MDKEGSVCMEEKLHLIKEYLGIYSNIIDKAEAESRMMIALWKNEKMPERYLRVVLKNECIDLLRQETRLYATMPIEEAHALESKEEDLSSDFKEFLDTINSEDRAVVMLRIPKEGCNMTIAMIAKELNVSATRIRSRLQRVKRQWKAYKEKQLEEQEK